MTSHDGAFTWPEVGPVQAPDWDPIPECGHGLHGLAHGEGDGTLLDWASDACWLVVDVKDDEVIDLQGKVKFPKGTVVHCGTQLTATNYLQANGLRGPIVGATVDAGVWGTANAGYKGTANAGDYGTANAGYKGTANAGDYGTANAGYKGTANAGYKGTANAGDCGTLIIKWYDREADRYRVSVAYVGENGIEPNVPYKLDDKGNFVKA
jgi:hypothetical protein